MHHGGDACLLSMYKQSSMNDKDFICCVEEIKANSHSLSCIAMTLENQNKRKSKRLSKTYYRSVIPSFMQIDLVDNTWYLRTDIWTCWSSFSKRIYNVGRFRVTTFNADLQYQI
jgi:hypothetical protein